MDKNGEGTKVSEKQIAIINVDREYFPMYSKSMVMKKGSSFVVGGSDQYIHQDTGKLVLMHWLGHGWHEIIPAEDFDLFIEETKTVITKTMRQA